MSHVVEMKYDRKIVIINNEKNPKNANFVRIKKKSYPKVFFIRLNSKIWGKMQGTPTLQT